MPSSIRFPVRRLNPWLRRCNPQLTWALTQALRCVVANALGLMAGWLAMTDPREVVRAALSRHPICSHITVITVSQPGRCDQCTVDVVFAALAEAGLKTAPRMSPPVRPPEGTITLVAMASGHLRAYRRWLAQNDLKLSDLPIPDHPLPVHIVSPAQP